MISSDVPSISTTDEQDGYQLEVHEVAELLGVTRTRVSQLTSSGQLSFERRRVGTRNRLFYKRSEVLNHQRSFYGRQLSSASPPESAFILGHDSLKITAERLRKGAIANQPLDGSRWLMSDGNPQSQSEWVAQVPQNISLFKSISELFAKFQSQLSHTMKQQTLSAASQKDEDSKEQLIRGLILRATDMSEELNHQRSMLLQLQNENRSLKRDIFQILQQQEKTIQLIRSQSFPVQSTSFFASLQGEQLLSDNATSPAESRTPAAKKSSRTLRQSRPVALRGKIQKKRS